MALALIREGPLGLQVTELGEQRLAGMGIEFTPAHLGWQRGVGAPETGKTGTGDNVDQAR